jgi:hypothetical protein
VTSQVFYRNGEDFEIFDDDEVAQHVLRLMSTSKWKNYDMAPHMVTKLGKVKEFKVQCRLNLMPFSSW